jgi:hypothetical protein
MRAVDGCPSFSSAEAERAPRSLQIMVQDGYAYVGQIHAIEAAALVGITDLAHVTA